MDLENLEQTIKDYNDQEIIDYLNKKISRSDEYNIEITITDSINNIIKASLKDVDESNGPDLKKIDKSDTYVFPDIHGRMDLFVQNLYLGNLIDKEGNWNGGKKKVIILGDMINRGPFSTENLVYIKTLKKQAETKGAKFEVLLGNHEHCVINNIPVGRDNITEPEMIKKMITNSIKDDTIKLSYADNEKNIICLHSNMEKSILISAIKNIIPEKTEEINPYNKISSDKIYKIMRENNITIEDVSNWMNKELKKDYSLRAPLLVERPTYGKAEGVINSRKKCYKKDKGKIDEYKTYKATQLLGHTTTNYSGNLRKATRFGAIKKINHNFFLDYDLLRGNQAFMAIDNNKIYQAYSRENGISKGFAKKMRFSTWDVSLIAKLPSKQKLNSNTKEPAESNLDWIRKILSKSKGGQKIYEREI